MRTAEFVSPKHPDKICDYISDVFVTELLKQDKSSRIAVEAMGGHGQINICGEVTTKGSVEKATEKIRREFAEYHVRTNIVKQSAEIAQGVDTGGAGDQGVMVGYACVDGNRDFMPKQYWLARELCKLIYETYPYDGKTQISLGDRGGITDVIASFQHSKNDILMDIIKEWLEGRHTTHPDIFTNPAGEWVEGGFDADAGVTGRKIVVDAYGPSVQVGGGAFSGKDPTKVDRSAAYKARQIAVDLLTRDTTTSEVKVFLSYGIGLKEPCQAIAIINGKERVLSSEDYDMTPQGIIKDLKLLEQDYSEICKWGHFGNDFIWDRPIK